MKYNNTKKAVVVLGIDLAKNSFHLHGVNEDENVVLTTNAVKLAATIFA